MNGGGNLLVYNNISIWLHRDFKRRKQQDINDYKFFCFNGKAKYFKIDSGRFTEHHANYYSPDGQPLPYGEVLYSPIKDKAIKMPLNLNEMIKIAERLSLGFAFLRVDFYNVNNNIYFSEITFYPASGFMTFTYDVDKMWGNSIIVSNKSYKNEHNIY